MYRTVMCNDLRKENIGQTVSLAGWVDTIRDHGGVIFLDLRDETGITQVVFHDGSMLDGIGRETVISVTGEVVERDAETVNAKIATGLVEVHVAQMEVLGACKSMLPFIPADSMETREEVRLKYRYLDLRNPWVHENIILRSRVITYLRRKMEDLGFLDIQTPILTADKWNSGSQRPAIQFHNRCHTQDRCKDPEDGCLDLHQLFLITADQHTHHCIRKTNKQSVSQNIASAVLIYH